MTHFVMATRRQFFRNSAAWAVTAALAPVPVLAGPGRGRTVSLDQVAFVQFSANVGTAFRAFAANVAVADLELVQAQPRRPANAREAGAPDGRNEKFALLFRGRPDQPLPQDTYTFQHPRIGTFAMFIVPIGSPAAGYRLYEAIFNRVVGRAVAAGRTQELRWG